MKQLIIDLESDGLFPSVVWCLCCLDVQTQEITSFRRPQVEEVQALIDQYDEVIGHNIIAYDAPVLTRLLHTNFSNVSVKDTLVLSRLANPSLEGGHSLKAWGNRLGFPKGDYNDWSKLTEEMVEYCEQDVRVTFKLLNTLTDTLLPFGEKSIELEHKVQPIISKQTINGWLLNQEKAYDLLATLQEQKNTIEEQVRGIFKPLPTFIKEIIPKLKKNDTISIVGLKFLGDAWTSVGGSFSRVDYPTFNLGSRKQIGRHLQKFGWRPKSFTATGHAEVNESILNEVKGIPQATLIATFLMLQKRIAQVQSWVDAVGDDGRVHGYVNTIGAVTGRMTHRSPNMAQVPASSSPYGTECRECWGTAPGYDLVGWDASGLELRMLAHYMADEDYTQEILNGDIHTANQIAAGLDTRDNAKTFIYAFLYGAGDSKIGSIVGAGKSKGRSLKAEFLKNTPSLAKLRDRVERSSKRGHLKGLDGRKLHIRSPHAALNTLLQSAGAIVMKEALILLDEYATIYRIDYKFVGNVHDEVQAEVRKDQVDVYGRLAVECLKAAGESFNLKCPLDADYKVGRTWADTH